MTALAVVVGGSVWFIGGAKKIPPVELCVKPCASCIIYYAGLPLSSNRPSNCAFSFTPCFLR